MKIAKKNELENGEKQECPFAVAVSIILIISRGTGFSRLYKIQMIPNILYICIIYSENRARIDMLLNFFLSYGIIKTKYYPKRGSSMINVFDVTEFGAVGDGVCDCTEAFQRAIDEAKKVKGTVIVPPGTYISATL